MSSSDEASRSEATSSAPLSVAVDLTVTVEGREATVTSTSTGDRLFVEFSSLRDALAVARAGGLSERLLERFATLLGTTDLTAEVRVRDRTVAVVGAGARPGFLSQQLGIAPVEARVGGVLGVVGRELAVARRTLERALR